MKKVEALGSVFESFLGQSRPKQYATGKTILLYKKLNDIEPILSEAYVFKIKGMISDLKERTAAEKIVMKAHPQSPLYTTLMQSIASGEEELLFLNDYCRKLKDTLYVIKLFLQQKKN